MRFKRKSLIDTFNEMAEQQVEFTPKMAMLLSKLRLPVKECIVNNLFNDSNTPLFQKREYCYTNCRFKCINGKVIKK
jgi:hypothetical protein